MPWMSGCADLSRDFNLLNLFRSGGTVVPADSYCYEYHNLIRKKGDGSIISKIPSREIKDRILANEERYKRDCSNFEGTKK